MGCKTLTPSIEIDWILQGEFSEDDLEYMPLCKILRFKKREEFGCGKCSKATEHEFSSRLLNAPPILVIHCKPLTYGELLSDGTYQTWVDGKVKRLEHSMALSTYSDTPLDRKSVSWAFYHLYGVVLRRGDGGTDGHYVCAFEQRQTGRWLFFDDEGRPVTRQLSRSQLDHRVETMIHDKRRSWSIFMLMYRKLFEVPVRLLARITSSSRAIALQNQQFQKESGQSKTEVAGQPETEEDGELEIQKSGEAGMGDAQEEYFTPEECVGDEDLLAESESGQTRGETQGPAGDERLLEDSSDSKIRHVQAEQSMPTEQPAVEADPESSTSKPNETQGAADDKLQSNPSDSKTPLGQAEQSMPIEQPAEQNVEVEADPELSIPKPATEQATGETQGAADNVSQRDASDSEIQNGQAEQPLPADPPTEQGVEVEADPESSTAKPDTTKSGSRAQAENENEQMTSSQPKSETVGTEIEPSAQPKKKQAKGKSAKRPRDKALDEDEETSTSVSASKKPKAGAKSSTQPKKKETQPDATTGNEDEKAEKSAPRIKKAKTVVEPSASYGGRETRARAAAKRKNDQIPDVDKNQDEQAATAQPASKKARTTKASEQTVKAQPKSKAGRKK
ncbi:hypothetical protein DPV78_004103 [Talaromyces pinophilus]|nr:hypothetical protein DPV78_004103 [Talaromyces pinophilus]